MLSAVPKVSFTVTITELGTEAQSGGVNCPRSHSQLVGKLDSSPGVSPSKAPQSLWNSILLALAVGVGR